jgi:tight adherence protein B
VTSVALATGLAVWLTVPPGPSPTARTRSGLTRGRLLAGGLVGAALAWVLLPRPWTGPVLVVSSGMLGAWSLWRVGVHARTAGRNAVLTAQVCDVLAAELEAGRPTEAALAEAVESWPQIRPVAEVCRLGGDVPDALHRASMRPGAAGLGLLAAAWVVAVRTGGGLSGATRRVADTVRRDLGTRRVVAGELASARATARLVAALPVLTLVMGSGAGGDPWQFLVGTPFGLCCLAGGLAFGLAGLWWMEMIAREVDR